MDLKVKQRAEEIIARFKNVAKTFETKNQPILDVRPPTLPDNDTEIAMWSDSDRLAYKYNHLKLLIVDHNDLYRLLCADWNTHEATVVKMVNVWFNSLSGKQRDEIFDKSFENLLSKTENHKKFFARFSKNKNFDLLNGSGDVVFSNVFLFEGQYYLTNHAVINITHLTPKSKLSW